MTKHLNHLFIALVIFIPTTVYTADWPEFRGPLGNGLVTESIPIQWSATENARWRTELPGEGWSSPIIVAGTIYLTAAIPLESSSTNNQVAKTADSGKARPIDSSIVPAVD